MGVNVVIGGKLVLPRPLELGLPLASLLSEEGLFAR